MAHCGSLMVVGGGVAVDAYAVVMAPGTLELKMTQQTERNVSPAFNICVSRIAALESDSISS